MAVKSEIIKGKERSEFPSLLISGSKNVWLTRDGLTATCVHSSGLSPDSVGDINDNLNTGLYEPFTGSITLSNE